ncbi:Conserved hypothetical secreted protein [Xanthomonas translucens pv. translucens DSM 18974]|uniref:Conserved hypothetical secreted protein n=3 Tax=Xanthomonas campestris pv. translucens TaxID=343 RepID=A0A1C3TT71_XANCT|nr:type IV secretion system protein VirB5 [Xanthomonas translucens pv. translucens DSM 18974]SCB06386.1 Conserved hypothetical secreted protein [Xanthomonas translucens pv. translucens DSM 18974]
MTEHSRRPRLLFSRFVVGLLLASGLCAGQANAQVLVNDNMSMGKAIQEYTKQAERWNETRKQYTQELGHYKQQLISLPRLNLGESTMPDNFEERPQDYGLEDTCPGAKGTGLKGLLDKFKSLAPNLKGDLVQEQLKICARMVLAQNAQYNESVRMLKRLIQRNTQFNKQVEAQRDSGGTSQGALAANDNEVHRFVAQNAMDLDYWQAQMTAYDNYIVSLKDDQSRLSRKALDGDKTGWLAPLGQIVQAATLAKALEN